MDSAVPWVSALLTAGRAYAPLSRRTLTGVRFCLGGAPEATERASHGHLCQRAVSRSEIPITKPRRSHVLSISLDEPSFAALRWPARWCLPARLRGCSLTSAPALASGYGEIGSFGPGPAGPSFGVFERPTGVAVEQATGDVYVYDAGESAAGEKGNIYKFSAGGTPEKFSDFPPTRSKASVAQGKDIARSRSPKKAPPRETSTSPTVTKLMSTPPAAKKSVQSLAKMHLVGWRSVPAAMSMSPWKLKKRSIVTLPSLMNTWPRSHRSSRRAVSPWTQPVTSTLRKIPSQVASPGTRNRNSTTKKKTNRAAIGAPVDSAGRTVALDPTNGDVYINELSDVAVYTSRLTPCRSIRLAQSLLRCRCGRRER